MINFYELIIFLFFLSLALWIEKKSFQNIWISSESFRNILKSLVPKLKNLVHLKIKLNVGVSS